MTKTLHVPSLTYHNDVVVYNVNSPYKDHILLILNISEVLKTYRTSRRVVWWGLWWGGFRGLQVQQGWLCLGLPVPRGEVLVVTVAAWPCLRRVGNTALAFRAVTISCCHVMSKHRVYKQDREILFLLTLKELGIYIIQ